MNSEKEIIVWWLNRNGYFTLASINAGMNKEIDVVAIKLANGVSEVIHVEVMVSISQSIAEEGDSKNIEKVIEKKFNDKMVQKRMKSIIAQHVGEGTEYRKMIVIGQLPRSRTKIIVERFQSQQIKVKMFDDILFELIQNIKGQNYNNPIIRTIQLFKYLLLSNPRKLAEMVQSENLLNRAERGRFVNYLLKSDMPNDIITSRFSEEDLIRILNHSSLKQPTRLARLLEENVFSKRSRKKFLNELLKQDTIRERITQQVSDISKDQKGLGEFFNV